MPYVDGFVMPVLTENLAAYRRLSTKAGKIWLEHGALEYRECAGDDLDVKFGVPFTKTIKARRLSSPGSCSSPGLIAIASTQR